MTKPEIFQKINMSIKYQLLGVKGMIAALSIAVVVSNTGVSLAQTSTSAANLRTAAATKVQETRVTNLKAKGDREIERRLQTLNNMTTRISQSTNLSASNKVSLTTLLQNEINNLVALKAKIDADTDITMLRTDIKSIVDGYRVYLLVVPQVGLVVAADTILTAAGRLSTISAKLQPQVTKTSDTALLNDANAKIAEAVTLATDGETAVLPLLPSGYPGNRSTLMVTRTKLAKARDDLRIARKNIETVMKNLRGVVPINSAASGSAILP